MSFSGCASTLLLLATDEVKQTELLLIDHLEPEDTFFASFQKVEKAFEEPEKYFSGIKYYIHNYKGDIHLKSFYFKNGRLIDYFAFCCDEGELEELNNLNFQYFNYKAEVKRAKKLFYEEAARRGEIWVLYGRDGNSWKIKIQTDQGLFELSRGEVNGEVDGLATYSEKIATLKRLVDFLALHSGRIQIGFD